MSPTAESTLARAPASGGMAPLVAALPLALAALALAAIFVCALIGLGAPWLDLRSLLIVLGGTCLVTALSATPGELAAALGALREIGLRERLSNDALIRRLLELADALRRRGPRALDAAQALRSDHFVRRALDLLADGPGADEVSGVLASETATFAEGADTASGLLRRAAEAAPALGLIGTLVGLIEMLSKLQDPGSLGPGMAVALLTTLYGAALGHLALSPLATRIERRADERVTAMTLVRVAAEGIAAQHPTRDIERRLNALVHPETRVRHTGLA
ncbi:MAG: MotA/TolQ/ExbB proton channel family protein [Alphaproteobacteria bacterium]|nr:MotA/TolQ/ExbB proton channel family protein [Alphaproteobacteria bacterium]